MSQAVASCGPECGDGFADGDIFGIGFLVDVTGVCEFALGGGCSAVDFAVCEGLEFGKLETVGECVDACVDEEAEAFVVRYG